MTTIQPCRPCIAEITFIAITMHAKEILGAMFFHLAAFIYLCGEVSGVFPFDRKKWISLNEFFYFNSNVFMQEVTKKFAHGKKYFQIVLFSSKSATDSPKSNIYYFCFDFALKVVV